MKSTIKIAAETILNGGLVGMPTETVYGLAADATNDQAVASVFDVKGRPSFNPLICHVASLDMARAIGEFDAISETLATAFWPGPLTLVVRKKHEAPLSLLVTAGLDTVAIRLPAHPIAQELIKAVGRPVAAPSANRSGTISPTRADHVEKSLGKKVPVIVDGGPTEVGLESTILRVIDGDVTLLRSGGIDRKAIERVAGQPLSKPKDKTIQSPGMMRSHYAPATPLRINAANPSATEAFLDFGEMHTDHDIRLDLSASGDMREAAANLFAHLHSLDVTCQKNAIAGIAVAPVPHTGLGEAINDRLKRAATPEK